MIGRENERTQILRALQRAKEASVARTIRLIGASGVGKSTLVGAATEQARTDGWLAILEPAHRVQVRLPFVVAWRMGAAIVAALGEEHERYTAGLPNDFSAEREGTQIEESLYRLFEGVLHDWPLLLAVDDVQWCDPESLGLLQRLIERFADRRIALLAVERRDEPGWPGLAQSDEAIVLEALSSGEAQQLVRALLPKATDDVVARIAEVSAGRAIDIIAIAESIEAEGAGDIESVTAGVRAVVARDLALLSPERREFLQMLALIEEPISLALLRRLWSEERFVPMLEASTGRYLVAAPDGFLFRHGALAQAVRETIAIEIPYRRRIIAAVSEQATLAIPELEQVIAQAKACGDNALELDYLKRLADAASTANELPLLARALERTIKLTPLSMDVLLPVYSQLSMVYNGLSRELDTIRISQEGISVARASATTAGFGPLVASLVLATWHSGDDATLQSILSTYENFFVLHDELAEIAYARMAVAIFDYDYDDFLKQFEKIGKLVARNAISDLRLATSEALMCARIGNASESARALRRARTIANDLPSALRFMPHAVERLTTFYQSGTSYAIAPSLWTNENRRANTDAAIDALCAASLGNIGDAYEVIRDALVATPGGFETRVLIGLSTSVGLCSGVPIP
ncbi:MAG TPA: ATP-binding protein, partial [Candidatus Dormibacteraeota bacterium]|nr:ATP-binding protein [Candidatus Dormibacteraeota bacterium]